jgi:hypothetical protein
MFCTTITININKGKVGSSMKITDYNKTIILRVGKKGNIYASNISTP